MNDPLLRPTATRSEVEARRAERRRKAAELADRVIASVAVDGLDAMQELDHLRGEYEDRRIALVAALHLPPETTWEEALARVAPVPAEVPAKGCRGCRFAFGMACSAIVHTSPLSPEVKAQVEDWITNRLGPDLLTPKPNAPECPGRVER